MFKLLAIRPLSGCASYIQKCLKTELMYYFSNDYIIEPNSYIRRRSKNLKPLGENFFSVESQSDYFRVNSSKIDFCPKVNVSAVVGMNGDGKSTLMELMIRLINNCAISYGLYASSDNLRRVNGVKAELYYMVDNVVYRIAEEEKQTKTEIWEVAKLEKKTGDNGDELVRWDIKPTAIDIKDIPNCFYFTIVSNYSHYAYNVYDYEREWEVRGSEKDDDDKCWLHYIFHKNDGYLTPITLHPLRYKGNIDINNEKWLSKQRLLSLFLNADNPSEDPFSFRRVNGKDANVLKLMEEPSSKLQGKVLLEYFEATKEENRFKELIDDIELLDDDLIQKSIFSNEDIDKKYISLVEHTVPSLFVNPINQIITQDSDFSVFANEVVDWINNKQETKDGDIIAVIKKYNEKFKKNDTYVQISECHREAKKHLDSREYVLALDQYTKAMDICENQLGYEHHFNALIYNDIAVLYEQLGEFEKALDYYNKSILIKESSLWMNQISKATTYGNIAGAYRANGNLDTAMQFCKKALHIVESNYDVNPNLRANAYNNLAMVYEDKEDYGTSLDYYYKAFDCREKLLKENDLQDISIYVNLARVYWSKYDIDNALNNYRKVIEKTEEIIGNGHIDMAPLYDNMGWLNESKGKSTDALFFFQKAMAIRKKTLGEKHPDTAFSYDNIAWGYLKKNYHISALEYYEKSLKIRTEFLGTDHSDTASSYENIAWINYKMGKYDKSLDSYSTALKIREKNLGKEHLTTATTYYNLACVLSRVGKYPEAKGYFEKSLSIREKFLGKDNDETVVTYSNTALTHMFLGNYRKAITYYKTVLSIKKGKKHKEHLDVAATYNDMAMVYKANNDHEQALKYYLKALVIKKDNNDTDSLDIALLNIKVAWEYYRKNNYDQMLKYVRDALIINEKVLGSKHPDTIHYYRLLAWIYKKKGDVDKMLEYYLKSTNTDVLKTNNLDPDTVTLLISDILYDNELDNYEKNESIQQLCPINNQKKVSLNKGKMDKRLEIDDGMEKIITKMKKQELLNTKKYKFLKYINASQLGRLDTIYRIMKSYDIDGKIVTKQYSDLTLKEKCQHYIVYKTWSILSTYPQYKEAYNKDTIESLREFGPKMEECVTDIINDSESHISRKLRQVKNFEKEGLQRGGLYERLKTTRGKSGELLIEIDKLKEYYRGKSFSLDNLPPPIYKWDIIFNKKDDSDVPIELDSFSSGEKQMLSSIGSVIYHLQNLSNTASRVSYRNVNLIMEEIELYYHPEYQRLFFTRLLDMIKRAKLHNIQNINIVFVTHSPFILSDIPKCNVLFLKAGMPKDDMQENTFGANIHSLLKNGFFMPNLPIGEFAYEKINKLFGRLNSGDFDSLNELDEIYQEILLVGEPFLRNQLLLLYNAYKRSGLKPQF